MRIVALALPIVSLLAAAVASGPGAADAHSLVQAQQRHRCDTQWQELAKRGEPAGHRAGFMRTCLADTNPTAALPPPRAIISAPAGATGVCKDGSYTAAVKGTAACAGHGGLSHWI